MIPRIQKGTLEFARLSRLYATRAGAHPTLAPYPTLDALLSAVFGRGQADLATRQRLLCAVLVEHQAAPGPLGAAIALHAFRGMLVHLSRSLQGVDDRDEADAIVATGLLEALKRVRPERDPDRMPMYVRQETRRAVFSSVRRDRRARHYQNDGEEGAVPRRTEAEPNDESREEEASQGDAGDDDAWSEEVVRDPLALERAARQLTPDAISDPESLAPLEDRLLFYRPTVEGIPDETLLLANAVRGGLRRLTNHLFGDASARERERMYRQLVRRVRELLATAT